MKTHNLKDSIRPEEKNPNNNSLSRAINSLEERIISAEKSMDKIPVFDEDPKIPEGYESIIIKNAFYMSVIPNIDEIKKELSFFEYLRSSHIFRIITILPLFYLNAEFAIEFAQIDKYQERSQIHYISALRKIYAMLQSDVRYELQKSEKPLNDPRVFFDPNSVLKRKTPIIETNMRGKHAHIRTTYTVETWYASSATVVYKP